MKRGEHLNEKTVNLRMPIALFNKIKEEAARKNISIASVIRIALSEYFEGK